MRDKLFTYKIEGPCFYLHPWDDLEDMQGVNLPQPKLRHLAICTPKYLDYFWIIFIF